MNSILATLLLASGAALQGAGDNSAPCAQPYDDSAITLVTSLQKPDDTGAEDGGCADTFACSHAEVADYLSADDWSDGSGRVADIGYWVEYPHYTLDPSYDSLSAHSTYINGVLDELELNSTAKANHALAIQVKLHQIKIAHDEHSGQGGDLLTARPSGEGFDLAWLMRADRTAAQATMDDHELTGAQNWFTDTSGDTYSNTCVGNWCVEEIEQNAHVADLRSTYTSSEPVFWTTMPTTSTWQINAFALNLTHSGALHTWIGENVVEALEDITGARGDSQLISALILWAGKTDSFVRWDDDCGTPEADSGACYVSGNDHAHGPLQTGCTETSRGYLSAAVDQYGLLDWEAAVRQAAVTVCSYVRANYNSTMRCILRSNPLWRNMVGGGTASAQWYTDNASNGIVGYYSKESSPP